MEKKYIEFIRFMKSRKRIYNSQNFLYRLWINTRRYKNIDLSVLLLFLSVCLQHFCDLKLCFISYFS